MKKVVVLFVAAAALFACGKDVGNRDKLSAIVVTGNYSDLKESTVKLYGYNYLEGEPGVSVVFGIEYSATDLTTEATRIKASEMDAKNKFIVHATDLSSNTLYYYRAYVLYNGVRTYGKVKTFTTKDFNATVATLDATDIGITKATISGSLSVNSTEDLSKTVWFLYSTSATTVDALRAEDNNLVATLQLDGTFNYSLESLSRGTTYYFVTVARVNDKEVYGSVKSFTTKIPNCPSGAVDLGLSVCWATCNLGASKPEDSGDYYAWGETASKSNYNWSTYKWYNGQDYPLILTKYVIEDDEWKIVLDPEDDAAHVKLGGNWHIPTKAQWIELMTSCTVTWTTQRGIIGNKVNGPNGNSIFLPAAAYRYDMNLYDNTCGYYWSSSLYTTSYSHAWCIYFHSQDRDLGSTALYRYFGFTVRPVTE